MAQSKYSRGKERYTSELELQHRQMYSYWYEAKLVICSKETFKTAQEAIESSVETLKERKIVYDIKKNLQLVSFGSVKGLKYITAMMTNCKKDDLDQQYTKDFLE